MSKAIKYLLALAILAVVFIVFYTKVYTNKITFEQTTPSVGQLKVKVFGIGNVSAKNIYPINSVTGGKISAIYTDEGQWVKKDELLVAMDAIDLPFILDEAKISIEKAQAELNATEKELISLNAQRDLALLTFNRNEQLKAQNLISQFDYDKAKTDLRVIDAQISATKAKITSASVEITRAKKAAQALSVKLSRYKIYAPVDGYIIAKNAEVAQSVTPSQPILTLVDAKTVWVKAYIDERLSGNIKLGQAAFITLRSQPDRIFTGKVQRIVAQTDAVTQEKEINISFDKLPIPFYINEQASVNIITKTLEQVIKIPSQYMSYHDDQVGVWQNISGKAHFQPLTIIAHGDNEIAVTGLNINSKIVLPDPQKKPLSENMSIR